MSDVAFQDPCILFPLRREAGPFLREFRPQQRFPGAPCWARFCGPAWLSVLVLQTGMGEAATRTALDWLLDKPKLGGVPYQPKLVLLAGFAGALQDRQVGDVILASEVVDRQAKRWPTTWPGSLPPGDWRPALHRARIVSISSLASSKEEKEALAAETGAAAVDMESAIVAQACERRKIPFGCVRVISDDVNSALSPAVMTMLRNGRVSWFRTIATLVRSPGLAGGLRRLAKQTHFGAEQLSKALGELLTLTLPFGAEL